MRVLILHDRYSDELPNGENAVVRWEADGLAEAGVTVHLEETPPDTLEQPMWLRGLKHLGGAYSIHWRQRTKRLIEEFRPDVVHVHNSWPHMTPSVYSACKEAGVPVVQTLHNYRLLCIADFLCRRGKPCELCLNKSVPWPGVRHRCVETSFSKSLVKATALGTHHLLGTWDKMVAAFVAPSEHMRKRFIQGGLDGARVFVKPTCAPDAGPGTSKGDYFCFAGRLRYEKGISLLLELWRDMDQAELVIAGAGPLEADVRAAAATNPKIRYLGMLSPGGVGELMRRARATLIASTWEEPCPVTLVQSYSAATAVIASDLGPRAEIVAHGRTGWIFPSGDLTALAKLVRRATADREGCERMGQEARQDYLANYSIQATCTQLIRIYRQQMAQPPEAP